MKSKLFGSLTARLILLLGVLLMLGQVGTVLVWRYYQQDAAIARAAERLTMQAEAIQSLLADVPADRRERLAAELTKPNRQITRASAGAPPAGAREPPPLLREKLQENLGSGADVWIDDSTGRTMAWIGLTIGDAPYWLTLPLSRRTSAVPPLVAQRLGLLGALVLIGAIIIVWQVNRPMRELSRAIATTGSGLEPLPEPVHAPLELSRIVETFNRLLAELRERQQEREALLAGVSHDLRSPLARLRLRAELAEDSALREGLTRDLDAMDRITAQFLAYVRGVDSPSGRPVAAGPLLRDIVARYQALGHDVSLSLDRADAIEVDGAALDRMASNLIDNAIVHGEPPVQVQLRRSEDQLTLSIVDHGEGLTEEDFRRAKQPYVRLDRARGGAGHCGLGLAIVERLITSLGGKLATERPPGGGFAVTVTWPMQASKPHAMAT